MVADTAKEFCVDFDPLQSSVLVHVQETTDYTRSWVAWEQQMTDSWNNPCNGQKRTMFTHK